MARRTWKLAVREEMPKIRELLAEANDDIRHKVIEQAWSARGQEQTCNIHDIYGSHERNDRFDTRDSVQNNPLYGRDDNQRHDQNREDYRDRQTEQERDEQEQ